MVGNLAVDYVFLHWRIWKVTHCCKMCENLVHVATTISNLQYLEYLKPPFLNTCEWAIKLVFPETVTYVAILYLYTSCDNAVKLCNRYTMASQDLPDIHAIALGPAA